ncbi:MAG: S9 family peptidase [Cellulomonas iranensis]|uniref:S9 family peptidase n=1 Tax=Cellulomonas iranensis TaxID=76862 RepID=UPI001AFF8E8C|nr:S9 family peptidase [Cellulomonas iranensis]MBO9568413.1 S9 family peptidase [Cellulomonas iranensis]
MLPTDLDLLTTPGAPALLPDGSAAVVAVTRPDLAADAYRGELWLAPLDAHDDAAGTGSARRLTHGHRDAEPEVSPDGLWVAFTRAPLTGGPGQVHVLPLAGGEPARLTDAPLGAASPRWSPDGTRLAFTARVPEAGRYLPGGDPSAEAPRHITTFSYREDGAGFVSDRPRHVHVLDVPADPGGAPDVPAAVALTSGPLEVTDAAWAPDGLALVATCARHATRERDVRRDAVLVAAPRGATGPAAVVPLTDADAGSTLRVDAVRVDGDTLWLLAADLGPDGTDTVAALTGLFRAPLTGTGAALRTAATPERLTDAERTDLGGVLHPTRGGVLVTLEDRGAVVLAHVAADGTTTRLLDAPHVVLGAAAVVHDGDLRVVASAATPTSAGALLRVDDDGRVLADWSGPLRATGRTVLPTPLTATSPDGYEVHGWLALPDPASHGAGPHPTLLMIHGGPFAQYTHALFDEVQVLTGAGYAVVLGNPRGSSGRGRAHGRAIRQAMGTVDTDDVLALLDAALEAHPQELDAARVGVLGGSYGGYLTAWLTTRTDRFAAAVVERGFLDPVSFTGSADIGWWFGLEYVGDHAVDPAAVAAQSPMAHVGQVTTPTLVVHSEQDWRCPVEQGQRWYVELRRRGVEAELLLFPGEGHELSRSGRPTHRRARFEHLIDWWARHLPVGG